MPWYKIALFYEYTITVRRSQLSGALDACRFAKEHFEWSKKSAIKHRPHIIGGVSFNPILFSEDPLKILMNMSEKSHEIPKMQLRKGWNSRIQDG